jgi:hypothetical protein
MPLQRGEVLGYDFNRMVVDFTMFNQGNMVRCAISTAAMDDLEGKVQRALAAGKTGSMLIWLIKYGHSPPFHCCFPAEQRMALSEAVRRSCAATTMHLLIPPMSLKYETGHGGECPDRSSSTADSAARVHTMSLSPPHAKWTVSTIGGLSDNELDRSSPRAKRCARFCRLFFDTPRVTSQRAILIFRVRPVAGHYEVSKYCRGGWGGVPGSLSQLSRTGSPMASMTGGMTMSGRDLLLADEPPPCSMILRPRSRSWR